MRCKMSANYYICHLDVVPNMNKEQRLRSFYLRKRLIEEQKFERIYSSQFNYRTSNEFVV